MIDMMAIPIGNTQHSLSQCQWSSFVEAVRSLLIRCVTEKLIDSGSRCDAPWQNHCFVAVHAR